MPRLTTGLIDNTAVSGVRPSTQVAIMIANDASVSTTVAIKGFYGSGSNKIQYVNELFAVAAGNIVNKTYFANLDSYEFQFTTGNSAVEISVWGLDAAGNLTTAHRLVTAELTQIGGEAYGYVYNTSSQSVTAGADVTFDSNGVLIGISHTAGEAPITISDAGDYLFTYVAGSTGAQQFELTIGNVAVDGTTYGIGISGANYGQVITTVATAGATATLRNASSSTIVLPVNQGGPAPTVNASLIVRKLS